MTTAVKPPPPTYVYYNCHKCGMSLTGPDTKLRFHPRDTRLGNLNKKTESVREVIFPGPYTGTFSNINGLRILANGKEKYSSYRQGDGDFYIEFQPDGSFKVRDREHVCVPLPKLTREEILALRQKGESPYMSDISPEDWAWVLDLPASDLAKLPESIPSKKTPTACEDPVLLRDQPINAIAESSESISSKERAKASSDANETTSTIYLFEALKDAAKFNILSFLNEIDKKAISRADVVFKLAISNYRYDCLMMRRNSGYAFGFEETDKTKTCTRTWQDVYAILCRKALEKEGRPIEEIDRRVKNLSITGCCLY